MHWFEARLMLLIDLAGVEMKIPGEDQLQPVHAYLLASASDLPATRKLSGLRSHSSKKWMCPLDTQPLCSLTHPDCFDAESEFLKFSSRNCNTLFNYWQRSLHGLIGDISSMPSRRELRMHVCVKNLRIKGESDGRHLTYCQIGCQVGIVRPNICMRRT